MHNKAFLKVLSIILTCSLSCQLQAFSQIDIMYAVSHADADKVAEYLSLDKNLVNAQQGEDMHTPLMRAFYDLHKVLVFKDTSKKAIINQTVLGLLDLVKGIPVTAISQLIIIIAGIKLNGYRVEFRDTSKQTGVVSFKDAKVQEKKSGILERIRGKNNQTEKSKKKQEKKDNANNEKNDQPVLPARTYEENQQTNINQPGLENSVTSGYQIIGSEPESKPEKPKPAKRGIMAKAIIETIQGLKEDEDVSALVNHYVAHYKPRISRTIDLLFMMFALGFMTAGIFGTCYGLKKGLDGANQLANVPVNIARRNYKIKNYERIILTLLSQEDINLNFTDKNGKTVHEILKQLMLECINDQRAYHTLRTFEILLNDQLKRA